MCEGAESTSQNEDDEAKKKVRPLPPAHAPRAPSPPLSIPAPPPCVSGGGAAGWSRGPRALSPHGGRTRSPWLATFPHPCSSLPLPSRRLSSCSTRSHTMALTADHLKVRRQGAKNARFFQWPRRSPFFAQRARLLALVSGRPGPPPTLKPGPLRVDACKGGGAPRRLTDGGARRRGRGRHAKTDEKNTLCHPTHPCSPSTASWPKPTARTS